MQSRSSRIAHISLIRRLPDERPGTHPSHIHEEAHKDYEGAKFGMWLFLFTEILLFGGLFILYSHTVHAIRSNSTKRGSISTLSSGRQYAHSSYQQPDRSRVHKRDSKRRAHAGDTLPGNNDYSGTLFLVDKYIEWSGEIGRGLYPNSPTMLQHPKGDQIFFGLYYSMTGLHGLHVLAGITLLFIMLVLVLRNKITGTDFNKLENAGLYWHLVDVIWIFLLPLFYLAA